MNERRYPWLILVPDQEGLIEIADLDESDQAQLIIESTWVGNQLRKHLAVDKLNVAAIGNLVPQLHLHVIGRRKSDAAWPSPVWGRFDPEPYGEAEKSLLISALQLNEILAFRAGDR
jgi:diadenosine tetraphosphate (Ap4A) HIT family hydrolase